MFSRGLDRLFEFCASLKLAVCVILAIAGLLGVATFYEARYGIPPVQELVYGSNLFLGVMAVLAINVMAAALIRYPWKRKQTGFVITHVGILTLLGGCLLSFRTSIDGRVSMQPGDSSREFVVGSERLQVEVGGKTWSTPATFWRAAGYPSVYRALLPGWPEPKWEGPGAVFEPGEGMRLEVLEWLPAAKLVRSVRAVDGGRPTVALTFAGSVPNGGKVREELLLSIPAGQTTVSRPMFEGLIEVELRVGGGVAPTTLPADGPRGRLVLTQRPDGTLGFEAVARSGARASGTVEKGAEKGVEFARFLSIGVVLDEHAASGQIDETYVAANVRPNKMNEATRAVRVAMTVGGVRQEAWVVRAAAPKVIDTSAGRAVLSYGFVGGELPFTVSLISAKRVNDPGSNDPAAFESTVMVTHADNSKSRHTITLNNPLVVGSLATGYTFYLSSFSDSLGFPVSTLAIRKDIGTVPKYAGCGLICLGIFTMFYMKAYFQKPVSAPWYQLVGGDA